MISPSYTLNFRLSAARFATLQALSLRHDKAPTTIARLILEQELDAVAKMLAEEALPPALAEARAVAAVK